MLGPELGDVARPFQHELEQPTGALRLRLVELIEQFEELGDALHGSSGHAGVVSAPQGVDERDAVRRSPRVELPDCGVTDATLRHVQHSLHADLVDRVHDGPHVRESILHLTAVVEARAADDLVGNAEAHQLIFDHPAHRVRSIEDGDIAPTFALVVQPADLVRHPLRLVALVVGVIAHDGGPGSGVGPQLLRLTSEVVGDHRVRRVEDRLRRPVVLLEHDHGAVGKRGFELQDVAHVCPAELVDRLIRVADDADIAMLTRELDHELVLHGVRVLVLVDENVLEPASVMVEHVGVLAEQRCREHQQVVEIHRAGLAQPLLILDVDIGDLALEDRTRALTEHGRGDVVVLRHADRRVH